MAIFDDTEPAYLHFQPRPDNPARFDQQTSFVEDQLHGVSFLVGGNGAGTTSAACSKISRFLLGTPPPRTDTPFWIIGESYEQICEVMWKEKLSGMQFLPDEEIDWARIVWRNTNLDHPYAVPLLSWPDHPGKNWLIEFKSYGQGRKQFQGRSIGGFCFVEQFPWSLLKEVQRGCREYNIPGSMMAEFTPIDPNLSVTLQEMQENGVLQPGQVPEKGRLYMPPGWGVYRANTECAMEAGHVDKEWFESFFGSMDDVEKAVRLIGAWASFEGQIYQTFNPSTNSPHNITLDEIYCRNDGTAFPLNVQHRRSIDWGFTQEHAFAALWGYWHPDTHSWVIYDEYFSTDQRLNIVEHLGAISDRMEWAEDGHYGMTFADPSRQDCIRIASRLNEYEYTTPGGEKRRANPIIIQNASNSVFEGIDHVRSQLKVTPSTGLPKLRICKETCPNLWRQMQTYRWVRSSDSGLNPRAAKPEPLKKDDDLVDALRYLLFSDTRQHGITIQQQAHKASATRRLVQLAGARG